MQVCIGGTWGYVCDNSWSTSDARVVCKQLGYSTCKSINSLKIDCVHFIIINFDCKKTCSLYPNDKKFSFWLR